MKEAILWILLVPANPSQFGIDQSRQLLEWRIVAQYEDYVDCESARRMIKGLTWNRDMGTFHAFDVGYCIEGEKLRSIGREPKP